MCRAITNALGLGRQSTPAPQPIEPPPPPPAPVVTNVAEQMATVDTAAQERERAMQRARQGRAATILTGGQGDTSAPALARPMASGGRTLLG